jgi:PIN domain nuclease of toxin-antitoxin system
MPTLYVIDTNCIIAYFYGVFCDERRLSSQAMKIIQIAFCQQEGEIKISIPSIVFVEIFERWFRDEEFARKFYYEVYMPIAESPNMEIKPIDQEVLQALLTIKGNLANHDLHDKIILASAIMLGCKLMTTDDEIISYVDTTHIIPGVLN